MREAFWYQRIRTLLASQLIVFEMIERAGEKFERYIT